MPDPIHVSKPHKGRYDAVDVRKLAVTGMFVAIGVLSAHLVYIPVGVSKCFPVQAAVNILLAVLLGTRYAVSAAFVTSVLRNVLGTGSLLAFPGSMFGAALAGFLFQRTQSIFGAIAGEVFGTGILGSLASYPVARYLIGSKVGALFFVVPFLLSAAGGAVVAFFLCQMPFMAYLREQLQRKA